MHDGSPAAEKYPWAQLVHIEVPPAEYFPAVHCTATAAGSTQLYPAGHGEQVIAPDVVTYLPSSHVLHDIMALDEYLPAAQMAGTPPPVHE